MRSSHPGTPNSRQAVGSSYCLPSSSKAPPYSTPPPCLDYSCSCSPSSSVACGAPSLGRTPSSCPKRWPTFHPATVVPLLTAQPLTVAALPLLVVPQPLQPTVVPLLVVLPPLLVVVLPLLDVLPPPVLPPTPSTSLPPLSPPLPLLIVVLLVLLRALPRCPC